MTVFQIIRRFRRWLSDREARAQAEVLRAYEAAWKAIAEELAKITSQQEASSDGDASPSLAPEQLRLRELERQIVEEIRKVGRVAAEVTLREQARLVQAAERYAARLIESQLDTGIAAEVAANFNRLPTDVINNIVGAASDGSPVRESFDRLARDLGLETGERVKTALVRGAALGLNPTEIARRVRREADATGDNPMRQASVVRRLNQTVRTESYRALREATRASYQASEVTQGWRWISALAPSTCTLCWAQHGKVFPLDVPLESHIACRCVMVPVLDPDESFETGPEKFAKLEAGYQKQILGESAFEAYRDGRIKIEDLVGVRDSARWGRSRYRRSLKEINLARPAGGRTVGESSGRAFDPESIGTPVRKLSTANIKVTPRGVDYVAQHLSRFGADKPNAVMVERLRRIAAGEMPATRQDLNFYAHELRENVRYKRLGHPQGEPKNREEARVLWNNAHTATLEEYGLRENRDALNNPLYHPEAAQYIER